MRELFLLLLLLGVVQMHSSAHASSSKKNQLDLTPPGQDEDDSEDPGSATRLLYQDPHSLSSAPSDSEKKSPVGIAPTCTDNMGMVYKQGTPGYDGCVRTFGGGTPPQLPGDKKNKSLGISL